MSERIVFFRPGALGDALLAFPTLALLRQARPAAHVTLVARGDVLPLARANGLADATSSFDVPAWSVLFADDLGSPPHDSLAARVVAGADVVAWLPDAAGTLAGRLHGLGAARVAVASGRPLAGEETHMALQLARALRPLGIDVPKTADALAALPRPLCGSCDDTRQAEAILAALGLDASDRVVALHPGSGGAAKRWPPDSFAEVAGLLAVRGLAPLLIEGPQDATICAAVCAASPVALPVARGLSLGALTALLGRCDGYLGNDSGVSHLAGLAGCQTLALFGPTDPAVWAPLGPRARTLRSPTTSLAHLPVQVVADEMLELVGQ